ncbi:sigma-54 interaction domain-containing protein [Pedosphaera parvula]|uniref:Sigma54 specific transcriptional regulator with PAS/PAC sensor, Fis family n=1 Tax=Pedosphaera parvula (strain Ellin514) TaxID=320771 RepID=B9XM81_PEDPL|nr:sigma 54-interacting transcriptional regulator [Pedosphaera parvula]EEF59074.1 sigma54 specific transcriptional regulator with PAS/PAC sensor, Fis family [Pedosphaera parvula Ellin514]
MATEVSQNTPVQDEVELLRNRITELEGLLGGQQNLKNLLGQREEFYRTVIESLAEGLLITDPNDHVIYANLRMEEITGYPVSELIGAVAYELLTDKAQWPQMTKRNQERVAGKSEFYEHQLLRKDGTRHWVSVKATPYKNSKGEIIGTVGAVSCIQTQKSLELENEYLLDEIRSERFGAIIASSPALKKVLQQIEVVAPTQANVLILGESGTGKELVARAIHDLSERKGKPLVRVNCASIPKELFESEFFGHVRGAFTGAIKDRVGRFELANGGSLFLDEIGEIPLDLQSKLLRVLQEGQFERVGEDRTRTVNVRIIAATNRDLLTEAKAGRFRLDLYYRLSVFPIEIPALRERPEDIGPLAEHFVKQSANRLGVTRPRLTKADVRELEGYDWPGNVRELQNVVERAVILARSGRLKFELGNNSERPFPPSARVPAPDGSIDHQPSLGELKQQEKQVILNALKQAQGRIYGEEGAAAILSMKPTTLASRIQRYGLKKADFK